MSQEIRTHGSKKYVTQTSRVGSKVVKKHIGRWSDPAVQLWYRAQELENAEYKASIANLEKENSISELIEQGMASLADFASTWQVGDILFHRFGLPPMETTVTDETRAPAQPHVPGSKTVLAARAVKRLCQLADAGDEESQNQLDQLMQEAKLASKNAFTPLETTKKLVIQSLSGESYVAVKAIEKNLDEAIRVIMNKSPSDPLARMYAEITALAYLDAIRCRVAVTREMHRKTDRSQSEKRADRSFRRFNQIATAMNKHIANVS